MGAKVKISIWARFLVIITLVLPLTACGQASTTAVTTPTTTQTTTTVVDSLSINDILQPILEKNKIPAMAALVIANGKVVGQGAVGVRKFGDPTPVTIDDEWVIGSCSKAFTTTMIAMLVEQGKLKWDTTMADVYPEYKDQMLPKYRDVTIMQLLCHHAGMRGNNNLNNFPPGTTDDYWLKLTTPIIQQRYEYSKDFLCQPDSEEVRALPAPGTTFLYSNVGPVIAAAAAEHVTGKSWEDLVTTMIFQPLGMTTAGFGTPEPAYLVDQPWLHFEISGQTYSVPPEKAGNFTTAILGPCGQIHMSIRDWAKFITMHLEGEKGGSPLLKPEIFKILHTPVYKDSSGYALGWFVYSSFMPSWPDGNGMVVYHGGNNSANYAMTMFSQERDFALLFATNTSSNGAQLAMIDAFTALTQKYLPPK